MILITKDKIIKNLFAILILMVITSCGPSENDLKELDKYNNAVISYLDKYNPELYISEINYGLCDGGYEESIHGRINCNSGELSTIIIKHLESKSLVGFERILLIEFENLPGIIIQSKPFYSNKYYAWGEHSPEDIYEHFKYYVDNDLELLSGWYNYIGGFKKYNSTIITEVIRLTSEGWDYELDRNDLDKIIDLHYEGNLKIKKIRLQLTGNISFDNIDINIPPTERRKLNPSYYDTNFPLTFSEKYEWILYPNPHCSRLDEIHKYIKRNADACYYNNTCSKGLYMFDYLYPTPTRVNTNPLPPGCK